jgi:Spy/CpxP family protein refolding chaperone
MLRKKSCSYLIVASVAMNVAFAALWIAHLSLSHAHLQETGPWETQQPILCPLHRELGVTEEQWTRIEPRLREFQTAVEELTQQTDAMRAEVIDLIAAEEPDREAIRAKQDEILATKRRIQGLTAEHLLAEKQDLTPDQQTRLFEMLRNRTSCANGPPMFGRSKDGLGPASQNSDESRK